MISRLTVKDLIPWVILLPSILSVAGAHALETLNCSACHATVVNSDAAHANVNCVDCHPEIKRFPHTGETPQSSSQGAACIHCHNDAVLAIEPSVHGQSTTCRDCHGNSHEIRPAADLRSRVAPKNQIETCGHCHAFPPELIDGYLGSVHGMALTRSGLLAAPSCSNCHGVHAIFSASDSRSRVTTLNIPDTCGSCHAYILDTWKRDSVHGALWRQHRVGPVCTSCHEAHRVRRLRGDSARLKCPETCGGCHGARVSTYRDTFHGQATDLGYLTAATCSDCHTAHQILPAQDSMSSVNQANIGETCGRCHGEVPASFLSFNIHLDPTDADRNPEVYVVWVLMVGLMIAVFGFFGLHDLLWLQRSIVGRVRGEFAHLAAPQEQRYIRRFSATNIVIHITMVVSFMLLAITGLILKFHYTAWAKNMSGVLGGLEVTRLLHRLGALITFGYAVSHLAYLSYLKLFKGESGILWGWRSMIPRRQDFEDFIKHLRYFLYVGERPQFDRWAYWEKFDYFAVFWGIVIIGLSGLILWFPEFFASFVPGWVLNAAQVVHSEEALLAVGFVLIFHFFHIHLRPESFPMDPVIFTGRMSLERFKQERPAEYRRLLETGTLEEYLAPRPTTQQLVFAYVFGIGAMVLGLLLIAGILRAIITGSQRL